MSTAYYMSIQAELEALGFDIVSKDLQRPWGAFFVINESQVQDFSAKFFDGMDSNDLKIKEKLSPKILVVKPRARLSWQYHHRRAEIWRVYKGTVGVVRSMDDSQKEVETLNQGDEIKLLQGERHRLIGLEDFAVVSEIWQHTDTVPSNEEDIVRLEDDFNRN